MPAIVYFSVPYWRFSRNMHALLGIFDIGDIKLIIGAPCVFPRKPKSPHLDLWTFDFAQINLLS